LKSKDQSFEGPFAMSTKLPKAGRPAFYTVRQTAWILGIPEWRVSRGIRLGTVRAVRRGSRLVVPVSEIVRLLNAGGARRDDA